jgi:preprotein translocase subunit SecG
MILYGFLMVLHVIASIALIIAVLLQAGRGGGLAATFGGGATQSMFGGRGAGDFLTKATQILGGTFMATSLSLFLLGGTLHGSNADDAILEQYRDRGAPATGQPGPPGTLPGGALPPISNAPLGTSPATGATGAPPPAGDTPGQPVSPASGSTSEPAPSPGTGQGATETPATGQ